MWKKVKQAIKDFQQKRRLAKEQRETNRQFLQDLEETCNHGKKMASELFIHPGPIPRLEFETLREKIRSFFCPY